MRKFARRNSSRAAPARITENFQISEGPVQKVHASNKSGEFYRDGVRLFAVRNSNFAKRPRPPPYVRRVFLHSLQRRILSGSVQFLPRLYRYVGATYTVYPKKRKKHRKKSIPVPRLGHGVYYRGGPWCERGRGTSGMGKKIHDFFYGALHEKFSACPFAARSRPPGTPSCLRSENSPV